MAGLLSGVLISGCPTSRPSGSSLAVGCVFVGFCRIKVQSGNMLFFFVMFPDYVFDPKIFPTPALSRRYHCSVCTLVSRLCPEPA
ncbi:hypothetical protein EH228_06235 [Erwinia endophytica]|nr:hypothetical protein EH228_06235 [Erwinia endophytica]